ncbi:Anthranilate synthase beta subunit 1, chloroplastic [Ananas comosus]|uniref:anthranilate synthase n=1 Tax=Ananas comosus TaxID=4615 RepID=A0A199VQH3_ANACO|nr:Anthranilate synthase beta subunit 1, chloroplastic [Ananas comosus]
MATSLRSFAAQIPGNPRALPKGEAFTGSHLSVPFDSSTEPTLLPRRSILLDLVLCVDLTGFVLGLRSGGLILRSRLSRSVVAPRASVSVVPNGSVRDGINKDERPIIVIDNYDSFTYNLCQYMGELGAYFEVYRNDELTVEDVKRKNPRGILISPGPGAPQDSGISLQTVLELGPSIPLFGVCMGLQCIGEAFGGKIVRAPSGVMHGKSSLVYYDEKKEPSLFHGLPKSYSRLIVLDKLILSLTTVSSCSPFTAGRYHSLVIENDTFPSDALEITAWTEDGLVMAARHKKYKHIQGVQFHPESIITSEGKKIVLNFIKFVEELESKTQMKANQM